MTDDEQFKMSAPFGPGLFKSTHCAVTLVQDVLTPRVVAVYCRFSERVAAGGTMMAVESLVKTTTLSGESPLMERNCAPIA